MKFITIIGVLLLGNSFTARAAYIDWVGYQNGVMTTYPDSGSFFHGDNWLNYLVPTTNDSAGFGMPRAMGNGNINHNPHYIHFGNFNVYAFAMANPLFVPGGDAVISYLDIYSDAWTFDFSSGQNSGAPFAPPMTGSLTAYSAIINHYNSSGSSPVLTIRNGTFHLQTTAYIGGGGHQGNLNVENGGRVEALFLLVTDGSLSILPGALVTCSNSPIANSTGSVAQATVAGSGARWMITNLLISGDYPFVSGGTGVLSVSNGGLVTLGVLTIGPQGTVKVVNGGRLGVGSFDPVLIPTNTVLIGTGGLVYGNGTFVGNLIVTNGGVIQPGGALIRTLTFSNALALAGQVEMQINRTNVPSSDLIRAAEISAGGSLVVFGNGATLLVGDTFQLFATTNFSGHFSNVQLPALSLGLGWDISGLSSNGTIKVSSTQTQPVLLPPQLSNGTNLQMKVKTLTGVKYVLQSTTNLTVPVTWKRTATNNGTGDVITFPHSLNSIPETFFRITVEP